MATVVFFSSIHLFHGIDRSQATGFVDFPIFIDRAHAYLTTGELYVTPDDLSAYGPAASVYKYPPFYALFLLPFADPSIRGTVYTVHWVLLLGIYTACGLLGFRLYGRRSGVAAFLFLIAAINFEPFFETLWHLQAETPFLLLLLVALSLHLRKQDFAAGLAIGFCASLKIYPVFLLLYFALKRRFSAFAGCAAMMALCLVCSLIVFGVETNRIYFFKILPYMFHETAALIPHNLGFGRYLQELAGLNGQAAKRVAQLLSVACLAPSAWVVFRNSTVPRDATRTGLEWALFVALMLTILPNCWSHYQVMLLLPIFALLGYASGPVPRRGWILGLTAAGYGLTLFFTPCAEPTLPFPCARTPYFLGLVQLPRPFHDLMVYAKVLGNVFVWVGLLVALGGRFTARSGTRPAETSPC